MLNKKLLLVVTSLLLFIGIGCGPSGPMADQDRTALVGVVIAEGSHDKVANATVNIVGEEMTTQTNENGTFVFVGIGVGSQEVSVESNQGSSNTTVEVMSGGTRAQLYVR